MDGYNKYTALANTIKIEDITSNKRNQSILHKLKNNDESFKELYIKDEYHPGDHHYTHEKGKDIGWLGYYIGRNTNLKTLHFHTACSPNAHVMFLYNGISCNNTIQKVKFWRCDLLDGSLFSMLDKFFKNNNRLEDILINRCTFGAGAVRQLSLAIGGSNQSLKEFQFEANNIIGSNGQLVADGQLVDIITALSMHPQLEHLHFNVMNMNIGRNECSALATLLRCTTTRLQSLTLYENNIDDEGIAVLVNGLANCNPLATLNLAANELVTIRGWKKLCTLFDTSNSLEDLSIYGNNIEDEGALVFANALSKNSTLESLDLDYCQITREGWIHFSKLLCDTSSVNGTYLSNHTLYYLGDAEEEENDHSGIPFHLGLNKKENKRQVAMAKILQHHFHFDMEPFFEWELKVLPIMIEWFTKAATCTYATQCPFHKKKMKLSAVFDFIKEFPMLYIEPVTQMEIAEYSALEEELQRSQIGDEQQAKLEEIRQRKARSMRRIGMK